MVLEATRGPRKPAPRRPRSRPPLAADAPAALRARLVTASFVALEWEPPRAARVRPRPGHRRFHVHVYRIFRDGKLVGHSAHPRFTDRRGLIPGARHRYAVRAYQRTGRAGSRSRLLLVEVATSSCVAGSSRASITQATRMTQEMVDRLFWRAGFGPSPADREDWIGRPVSGLVEWLLGAPQSYTSHALAPLTDANGLIDPLVTNTELVLEWLDRMQRVENPFFERMNFFWHRHWAVSRLDGVPAAFLLAYRDRLQRYSDFATNPTASFGPLALEMTTEDAAMSYFLNGYENNKVHPNENYAREFMELFCIGATNAAGAANYSQTDVEQLARAFTGWSLNNTVTSPAYGQVSFRPSVYDGGVKTILGQTGAFDAAQAVQIVLAQPSHGPHIVNKLWSEFIATPIPPATLAQLVTVYTAPANGLALLPLLRGILSHPLIFESLCEPNLVKPPIVHMVGILRAMGVPLKGASLPTALNNMQQLPYSPPNVSGWEGGLSWLNSGTADARFNAVVRAQSILYGGYPGTAPVEDLPKETWEQAYGRAYESVGAPWLSTQTQALLLAYARAAPASTPSLRRQRIYSLQASMLGGPDGQVM